MRNALSQRGHPSVITLAAAVAATAVLAAVLTTSAASGAGSDDLQCYALKANNRLIPIKCADPSDFSKRRVIAPLGANEDAVGIDFRATDGELYMATYERPNLARLYTLDPATGAATFRCVIDAALNTTTANSVGMDFNPLDDYLRIVTDRDQNLRVDPDPDAGLCDAVEEGALHYDSHDPNRNVNPQVTAAAYGVVPDDDDSAKSGGGPHAVLFDIDVRPDDVVLQHPPADGTLFKLFNLPLNATPPSGADIACGDDDARETVGLASLRQRGERAQLYDIHGSEGIIGPLPGAIIRSIAIDPATCPEDGS